MESNNINKAIDTMWSRGGFTYSFSTGELNPSEGFSISVGKTHEKVINNVQRLKKSFVKEQIKAYAMDKMDALVAGDRYLGCWVNDNKLYLDVMEVVQDTRENVEKLCIERGQSAYWENEVRKVRRLITQK